MKPWNEDINTKMFIIFVQSLAGNESLDSYDELSKTETFELFVCYLGIVRTVWSDLNK